MSTSNSRSKRMSNQQEGVLCTTFSNKNCMNFNETEITNNTAPANFWNKVLQYVQGRNKDSNLFEKYVEMKKAKREIEVKFSSDLKACETVLNSRELFSKYIFDSYLLPEIKSKGAMFKEDDKYKMYMNFINDEQFYIKIKNNYLLKEVRRDS